jgi:hypothetical protein
VLIDYDPNAWGGQVVIKTWVEQYTKEDVDSINNLWQPTGTSWFDSQAAAKRLEEE